MKKQLGFTLSGIGYAVFAVLFLGGAYGWVSNIIKLVAMLDGAVTAMFVARIVGMFAVPLGAVLGYF